MDDTMAWTTFESELAVRLVLRGSVDDLAGLLRITTRRAKELIGKGIDDPYPFIQIQSGKGPKRRQVTTKTLSIQSPAFKPMPTMR